MRGRVERVTGLLFFINLTRKPFQEILMKNSQWLFLSIAFGITIIFFGCTKDNPVAFHSRITDEQALRAKVERADSIAQFSGSDEATIDDHGLREPEYLGREDDAIVNSISTLSGTRDSSSPVRWGRHIKREQIVRDYHIDILGDTGAIVTIVKTIPGEFLVGWGYRTPDTVVVDTIVRKPFTQIVTRKIQFKRVANSDDPHRNWRPVALTLVQGKNQGTLTFSITSLEIIDPRLPAPPPVVTDPLNTWLRLGWRHPAVPVILAGDSIVVHVTITSSNDSNEIVALRHGIDGIGPQRGRARMLLVSVTGSPGNYTRVYEKIFHANAPRRDIIARLNAVIDVLSYGSIFSKEEPFTNEFWGMPYILIH